MTQQTKTGIAIGLALGALAVIAARIRRLEIDARYTTNIISGHLYQHERTNTP